MLLSVQVSAIYRTLESRFASICVPIMTLMDYRLIAISVTRVPALCALGLSQFCVPVTQSLIKSGREYVLLCEANLCFQQR